MGFNRRKMEDQRRTSERLLCRRAARWFRHSRREQRRPRLWERAGVLCPHRTRVPAICPITCRVQRRLAEIRGLPSVRMESAPAHAVFRHFRRLSRPLRSQARVTSVVQPTWAPPVGEFAASELRRTPRRASPECAVAESPASIACRRGGFGSDRPEHRVTPLHSQESALRRPHLRAIRPVRPPGHRSSRRESSTALFGWVDRSTVAGRHAAFRFDYRIAQSQSDKALEDKKPAGALRR